MNKRCSICLRYKKDHRDMVLNSVTLKGRHREQLICSDCETRSIVACAICNSDIKHEEAVAYNEEHVCYECWKKHRYTLAVCHECGRELLAPDYEYDSNDNIVCYDCKQARRDANE